jgi:hypothetical protein
MRLHDLLEADIKLTDTSAKAKEWIEKVYSIYPHTFQNNHVMSWGEGDDQQFAMFELTPSFSRRGAVEVKWFQAYPLRQGVGSKAMRELQRLAREDGVALTLYPWDKGQVSQAKLTKFYKGHGFTPTVKGGKHLQWENVTEDVNLVKDHWTLLISSADKHELGNELVDLVQHAYNRTPMGSFVKSIQDVVPSDWKVIDWDHDPDVDACVFYRQAREGETFQGFKIQGIGHDGQQASKNKAVEELVKLLNKPGYWIESSDAMRATLRKFSAPVVTDVELLQQLFDDRELTMIDNMTYRRHLQSGQAIIETVFGKPVLKR